MLTFLAFLLGSSEPSSCVQFSFAHRTGRDSCWAEYQLDRDQKLCLSHWTWIQWLNSSEPEALCRDLKGRWRTYSPLQNAVQDSLQNSGQNSVSARPDKKTISIHQLELSGRKSPSRLLRWKQSLEKLREKTSELLAPYDSIGILRSLILDQGSSREPLPFLRRLGFVHLVTASGIHLYAWIASWEKLMRSLSFLTGISIPAGIMLSRIHSWSGCLLLWILTGLRAGLLRPGIIVLARELSKTLGFRWSKGSPLFLALLLDTIAHFHHSRGRWHYALAIGGGLLWHPCFRSIHIGLAIGSWIGVAAWECWETGMIALATPLLSLFTLPLVCLWIYPLLIFAVLFHLIGLTPVADILVQALALPIHHGILVLTRLAMLPGNLWIIPRSSLVLGLIVSTLLLLIYPKLFTEKFTKTEWKWSFAVIVFLVLARVSFGNESISERSSGFAASQPASRPASQAALQPTFRPASQPASQAAPRPAAQSASQPASRPASLAATEITQLDVGQGDAALVLTEKRGSKVAGAIDTGSEHALSDLAWVQVLAQRQVRELHWLALTHLDEDHSGGLLRLAKLVPIHCISVPTQELTHPKGIKLARTLQSYGIQLQDWNADCIPYPTLQTTAKKAKNKYMGSVWVPLQSGGFYLSSGDAGSEEEPLIGAWAKPLIESLRPNGCQGECRDGCHGGGKTGYDHAPRILKLNHHGSKNSNSVPFLKLISPTEAWVSSGRNNRYGHPSVVVLRNLERLGIPLRRTDQEGAIDSRISQQ